MDEYEVEMRFNNKSIGVSKVDERRLQALIDYLEKSNFTLFVKKAGERKAKPVLLSGRKVIPVKK